ncbi:DUF2149 domain-containing protein [Telmatocola sphagniphila]|uniref:DUF2149 domain-containing protein n=1 Tax=Telmatocola sphagniphila TaxID=1123043 RepID=A0A8E6B8Q4_9BACT|nr:DUF2149 domain-containing protein [Telmatocola sphagniphila]QVL33201.1 DUF2149 domain-containing protein [Telmatocola sphagniphila]
MRKKRKWELEEDDPAAGLLNLFDVWLVFAVAVLLATWTVTRNSEASGTPVKNPGEPDMEIVTQQGKEVETLRMTNNQLTGEGERLGTAYRLKSGKVVYVPEKKK